MSKNTKLEKAIDFQDYLAKQLKNSKIKKHYEAIDFTKIKKGGVNIDEVLSRL
ncbi:MAG: hypothetical protein ABIG10_00700 [bacterium]